MLKSFAVGGKTAIFTPMKNLFLKYWKTILTFYALFLIAFFVLNLILNLSEHIAPTK